MLTRCSSGQNEESCLMEKIRERGQYVWVFDDGKGVRELLSRGVSGNALVSVENEQGEEV